MAEVNLFHFQKGSTILHKMDTRFKLILLILYSTLIFRTGSIGIIVLSSIIVIFFLHTLQVPAGLIREMKGVFFIIALIFAGTLFTTHGEIIIDSIPFITKEGFIKGFSESWKFLMVVFIGLIFSATTMPEQIHSAVYIILKPIPFINEVSVASKLSLTIMFIPILMDMLNEVLEARKTRFIEGSRNPVRNIISLAVPITAGVINRADESSMALESRLYSGETGIEKNTLSCKDYLFLFYGIIPILAIIIFQIIGIYI